MRLVVLYVFRFTYAGVAELADVRDLGSRVERREGSIPFSRTTGDKLQATQIY